MEKITRFGVSLPEKLVEEFDNLISESGYSNRSKAIKSAIIEFITQREWEKGKKEFIGIISYIYNHESGGVVHKLIEIQHSHSNLIKSTTHTHISGEDCAEVLIIIGNPEKIKNLHGRISAVRGVKNCKISALLE